MKTFSSRINITRINLPEEKATVYFKRNLKNISTELPVPDTVPDRSYQVISSGNNGFYWSFFNGHKVTVSYGDNGWKISWKNPAGAETETVIPFAGSVLVCNVQKKVVFQGRKD